MLALTDWVGGRKSSAYSSGRIDGILTGLAKPRLATRLLAPGTSAASRADTTCVKIFIDGYGEARHSLCAQSKTTRPVSLSEQSGRPSMLVLQANSSGRYRPKAFVTDVDALQRHFIECFTI